MTKGILTKGNTPPNVRAFHLRRHVLPVFAAKRPEHAGVGVGGLGGGVGVPLMAAARGWWGVAAVLCPWATRAAVARWSVVSVVVVVVVVSVIRGSICNL
jgi:hypothetical protein